MTSPPPATFKAKQRFIAGRHPEVQLAVSTMLMVYQLESVKGYEHNKEPLRQHMSHPVAEIPAATPYSTSILDQYSSTASMGLSTATNTYGLPVDPSIHCPLDSGTL